VEAAAALWIGWPLRDRRARRAVVGARARDHPPKIRGTRYVLDREWFCKWFLGRRVWLMLGLMFHGNLQLFMNIGMFPPIMMSIYLGTSSATSRGGSCGCSRGRSCACSRGWPGARRC
jgi:hypothetical protein